MYAKQRANVQARFKERKDIFLHDRMHPLLRDHALDGKWIGHRSINVTGDIRAVYRMESSDLCIFVAIGTHPELYGS